MLFRSKGLIEHVEIPKNAAIIAGDELEMLVFEHLKMNDDRYESNPLWVSDKYSRSNVKLISHPDLVLVDDEKKTINVYECKCTKYGIQETRQTYKAQLYIHFMLAKEKAESLGREWKVKLFLVHYSTEGMDLEQGFEFDADRLTVREVKFHAPYFDIAMTMNIIDAFLDTFTEYYEGDEIDANLLPEKVRDEFTAISNFLMEIKEREEKVADFKKRLYAFMVAKNIKSIKNESFNIVRVDETESKSFDGKRYIEEYAAKHPRKAKRIIAEYTKTVKRNGFVTIKVKS